MCVSGVGPGGLAIPHPTRQPLMRTAHFFLLVGLLVLSGCFLRRGNSEPAPPPAFAQLAGVWEDPATQDRHFIRWANGRFSVTGVESSGGERYTLDRSAWEDGALTWRYRVPRSRYAITLTTRSVAPRALTLLWQDTDGVEQELVLTRVDGRR